MRSRPWLMTDPGLTSKVFVVLVNLSSTTSVATRSASGVGSVTGLSGSAALSCVAALWATSVSGTAFWATSFWATALWP